MKIPFLRELKKKYVLGQLILSLNPVRIKQQQRPAAGSPADTRYRENEILHSIA